MSWIAKYQLYTSNQFKLAKMILTIHIMSALSTRQKRELVHSPQLVIRLTT
jgi:hypothetical protein